MHTHTHIYTNFVALGEKKPRVTISQCWTKVVRNSTRVKVEVMVQKSTMQK